MLVKLLLWEIAITITNTNTPTNTITITIIRNEKHQKENTIIDYLMNYLINQQSF